MHTNTQIDLLDQQIHKCFDENAHTHTGVYQQTNAHIKLNNQIKTIGRIYYTHRHTITHIINDIQEINAELRERISVQ